MTDNPANKNLDDATFAKCGYTPLPPRPHPSQVCRPIAETAS